MMRGDDQLGKGRARLRSDLLMEVVGPCCRQLEDLYQVRGKLNRQVLSVQAQCIERCTFLIQHPCAHTELPIMAPFTATLLIAIFCALAWPICRGSCSIFSIIVFAARTVVLFQGLYCKGHHVLQIACKACFQRLGNGSKQAVSVLPQLGVIQMEALDAEGHDLGYELDCYLLRGSQVLQQQAHALSGAAAAGEQLRALYGEEVLQGRQHRSNIGCKVCGSSGCCGGNSTERHFLDVVVIGGSTMAQHPHQPLYQLRHEGQDVLPIHVLAKRVQRIACTLLHNRIWVRHDSKHSRQDCRIMRHHVIRHELGHLADGKGSCTPDILVRVPQACQHQGQYVFLQALAQQLCTALTHHRQHRHSTTAVLRVRGGCRLLGERQHLWADQC
mmetsp:Transcript_28426/g.76731  ORF Transcript_28426/g.76731 Transcript_28426/m.76731 type:complete len:386 (+) Transcript_28426:1345-2502(+)